MSKVDPLVSVCMITYNHEKYISQAIEGVLIQQTNFAFELIIGEDCSTDNTRKICLEYKEKYPNIIRLLLPDVNLGMSKNFIETIQAATGKYIAFCEGDDYWTDSEKLQKQVSFLDANQKYSFCCHRFRVLNDITKKWDEDVPNNYRARLFEGKEHIDISLESQFKVWLTQPLTVVFCREKLSLEEARKYKYFRDVHLFFLLLSRGGGRCINFVGAVYRQHDGGVYSRIPYEKKMYDSLQIQKELYLHNKDNEVLKRVYRKVIEKYLARFAKNDIETKILKCEYKKLTDSKFSGLTLKFHIMYHLLKDIYIKFK